MPANRFLPPRMSALQSRVVPLRACDAVGDDLQIPATEFERFQEYFYRKTGIVFGAPKRQFVEHRLAGRMAARGTASVRSYLAFLKFEDSAGSELQLLVNALTVNETYFYREEYQFDCLVSSILPELTANRKPGEGPPIRIWSLPCSTGEEAYSLAIRLLETWRDVDHHDVEIIGSDIDSRVIAQARAGVYDDRAVKNLPDAALRRYFEHIPGGRWRISETLRASVDFGVLNITDAAAMRPHRGAFDVVFCRNLLIYFDDVSRRAAVEAIYDALRPGGFVCLGHSESMSRISSLFTLRKFPAAIVYQKPRS
jgi:chemotaxis protein methyltransferase CheR